MRHVLILLAGVVLGVMLALIAANALQQRDAYRRSVMVILQHHFASLRQARRRGDCSTGTLQPGYTGIVRLAQEIEGAFAATESPAFVDSSRRFASQSQAWAENPARDCPGLDKHLAQINEACDDCHRQYR